MDDAARLKLETKLKQLPERGKAERWYFAWVASVNPPEAPEDPFLYVDKQPVTRETFVTQVKARWKMTLPAPRREVFVGRISRQGAQTVFEVDASRSAAARSTATIQLALTRFAVLSRLTTLKPKLEVLEDHPPAAKPQPTSGQGQAPPRPPRRPEAPKPDVAVGGAFSATALNRMKITWITARSQVMKEHNELLRAIYSDPDVRADDELRRRASHIKQSGWGLSAFDDAFERALDELGAAEAPDEQVRRLGAARAVIDRYRRALESDRILQRIDDNPFHKVEIYATLDKTLRGLERVLGG